ncbi:hypothetical protein AKL17_1p0018 (plasmid) [Frigidibacter mobilis]|uniref:Uncharacterized protein n=1 Tax=Frigidibacter mobilis TaxID=1335048 RepID=A0A165SWZ0_9RHOB|nr:hypothetical protein AKL17_1p0018 [Frigidibacter mobilis]
MLLDRRGEFVARFPSAFSFFLRSSALNAIGASLVSMTSR